METTKNKLKHRAAFGAISLVAFALVGCPMTGIEEVELNNTAAEAHSNNQRNYSKDDLANQAFVGSLSSDSDVDRFHFMTTTGDNNLTIALTSVNPADLEPNDQCVSAIVRKCTKDNISNFANCPDGYVKKVAAVTTCGMERQGFQIWVPGTGYRWVNRRNVKANQNMKFRVGDSARLFQVSVRKQKDIPNRSITLCSDDGPTSDAWDFAPGLDPVAKSQARVFTDLMSFGGLTDGPEGIPLDPVTSAIVDFFSGDNDYCSTSTIKATTVMKVNASAGVAGVRGTPGSRYYFSITKTP